MCPKHPRDISSFRAASNQLAAASQSHAQTSVQPAPARTLPMSSSPATTVPTDRPRPGKVIIDTKNLNEQDLKTIKKCDPFLYYSIPFVRDAEVNRSGEFQITLHDHHDDGDADGDDTQSSIIKTKVERKSRISYECHPDLLLADLLDDLDDLDLHPNEQERA